MKKRGDGASSETSGGQVVDDASSLPQRIGASASGLLQTALEKTSANTLAETLASSDTEIVKGWSGTSSNRNDEGSVTTQSSTFGKKQSIREISSPDEVFRFGHMHGLRRKRTIQAAFDEFVATGPQMDLDAVHALQTGPASNDRRRINSADAEVEAYHVLTRCDSSQKKASEKLAVTQADKNPFQVLAEFKRDAGRLSGFFEDHKESDKDGAEVVALLSDPAFSADETPVHPLDGREPNPMNVLQVKSDHHFTPKMTFATHSTENLLDLIPDFTLASEHFVTSIFTESEDCCSVANETAFREVGDVQPWIAMLDRYHDEVWGNLLPFIQEARKETRVASSSLSALEDRPAIRRLGMLLQHLKLPVT